MKEEKERKNGEGKGMRKKGKQFEGNCVGVRGPAPCLCLRPRRLGISPYHPPHHEISTRSFLGSGPDRGRSPVEWGDFPFVRSFVCSFVRSSVPPRGLSQAQGGPSQVLGGPSQALEDQIQALGGPSQALARPGEAKLGPGRPQPGPGDPIEPYPGPSIDLPGPGLGLPGPG